MDIHLIFLVLGSLLLIGLMANEIGRRTRLPRVPLMILFGAAAGPSGFNLLPTAFRSWYDFLASTALTMVVFLLGAKAIVGDGGIEILQQGSWEIAGALLVGLPAAFLTDRLTPGEPMQAEALGVVFFMRWACDVDGGFVSADGHDSRRVDRQSRLAGPAPFE